MINVNQQISILENCLITQKPRRQKRLCKNITFDKLFKQYIVWRKCQVNPSTIVNGLSIKNKFFNQFNGLLLCDVFNKHFITVWYKNLIKNSTINGSRKNCVIAKLKALLKFAYMHKYVKVTVFQDCDLILIPIHINKKNITEKVAWTVLEVNNFLHACSSNYKDYLMFRIFIALGARLGEFLALMPKCLDLANNRIRITQQVKNISGTKKFKLSDILKTTNSYRSVMINQELANDITNYIQTFKLKDNDYLFFSFHKKQVISRQTFRKKLVYYCNKANVRIISPHSIRHTIATRLASLCNNATDIEAAAKILGHSSTMFLQTYAQHNTEKAELSLCNKLWKIESKS